MANPDSSHLSLPQYGYDVVVGTAQASIDATMKRFLKSNEAPMVELCYVMRDEVLERIPMEELIRESGVNPFSIPNGSKLSDPAVLKLLDVEFVAAIRAQLGVPQGMKNADIPQIISLDAGTAAVKFQMLCSTFQVASVDAFGAVKWTNLSQTAKEPWIFVSKVDLRLSTASETQYKDFPAPIQEKISRLNDFSVQQLLFNLLTASLYTQPTIVGVRENSALHYILATYFVGGYMRELKQKGDPLFGVVVIPKQTKSTLEITGFDFMTNPYMGSDKLPVRSPDQEQRNCQTLNYLCATNRRPVRSSNILTWNWVPTSSLSSYDGVIAINRKSFVDWIWPQLEKHCHDNSIEVVNLDITFESATKVKYHWNLQGGAHGTKTENPTGTRVLSYRYSSGKEKKRTRLTFPYEISVETVYELDIDFIDNKIVITQVARCYLYVKFEFTSANGNVIDKKIIDTYYIDVEPKQGRLVFNHPDPEIIDHSMNPNHSNPFLKIVYFDFTKFVTSIAEKLREYGSAKLSQDVPLQQLSEFVFPGGQTFMFKKFRFSDYQDALAELTYKDPSPTLHFMPSSEPESMTLPISTDRVKAAAKSKSEIKA